MNAARPTLNAATMKTLARVRAACKDGKPAGLERFDIVHVGRLERAGLVVTSTEGAAAFAPNASWTVRPV